MVDSKENCKFDLGIKGLTEHDRAPLSAPIKKQRNESLNTKTGQHYIYYKQSFPYHCKVRLIPN